MTRRKRRARRRKLRRVVTLLLLLTVGLGSYYWYAHRGVPAADTQVPDWVEQDFLPINPYSRPATPLEVIDGVVVHYVGNPATTASANRSFFANLALTHETYASAHFVVGLDGEIIQCVPLTEVAYCSSEANDHTISIEVCHEDETGEFNEKSMESLQKLVAWLCEEFDLPTESVIRHYDVTGKICPKYYVEQPDAWAQFLSDIDERRAAAQDEGEMP